MLSPVGAFAERQRIKAIGIPLADHYAGIIAYEKYRKVMQFADYQLKLLPGPALVRAYFTSEPDADIAFNVSPMVMDMFSEKENFRWVSLIHRDGNAFAINQVLNDRAKLPFDRKLRQPDSKIADAIRAFKQQTGKAVEIGIPSRLATHTSILYKYLKDNDLTIGTHKSDDVDVYLRVVKPPESPVYLKKKTARSLPAGFTQSLPWAEVAEEQGTGYLGWYSKDVMHNEQGHVECVIIAKDGVIRDKREALQEVIYYIHKAGQDIENARLEGGAAMSEIVRMIRKHIPAHSKESILVSLRADLNVINYHNLGINISALDSIKEIMNLAVEAGFIKHKININDLADRSFSSFNKD
jgi:NitT/TauT family transport system substrate-binding protein